MRKITRNIDGFYFDNFGNRYTANGKPYFVQTKEGEVPLTIEEMSNAERIRF